MNASAVPRVGPAHSRILCNYNKRAGLDRSASHGQSAVIGRTDDHRHRVDRGLSASVLHSLRLPRGSYERQCGRGLLARRRKVSLVRPRSCGAHPISCCSYCTSGCSMHERSEGSDDSALHGSLRFTCAEAGDPVGQVGAPPQWVESGHSRR